ncbi:hypothetical protein JOL62DRAFT_596589 [Phyllosticta paracitricarpa]|uniref:ubiquitinyl hydrolase 1 n=1 Tax=Phyllosticta paracitricarpa TaxID=2016321 RepID=A0ABR1NH55_9PEZI
MVGPMNSNSDVLERLVRHVVLPEKLPERQEESNPEIATALTESLLQASRVFKDRAPHEDFRLWDDLRRVIVTAKEVNCNGQLSKVSLIQAFHELEPGGVIILHVREQNAGLLISRPLRESSSVIFEAFEASPRSEDVLAAPDALQWDFPGATVVIPYAEFSEESFQEGLAYFLQQSSTQALKQFAARARKSGSAVVEIRDTTDPAIITHMLMTLLESYGVRTNAPVLRKRVRDDVCWSDGAEMPWRRCPDWLVLRVGLARYLCNTHGGEVGRARYKFLMCLVLSNLLRDSVGVVSVQLLHNLRAKLARRLAKLETQRISCSVAAVAVYESFFSVFGPLFHESLQKASEHMESEWAAFKRKTQRTVRPLPHRADTTNLFLNLPKSGAYLERILLNPFRTDHHGFFRAQFDRSVVNPAYGAFGGLYHGLHGMEHEIEDGRFACSIEHLDEESACAEISRKVESYLRSVGPAYDGMAEEKSLMILTTLDLWRMMDQHAIKALPLLSRYHPAFSPSALNILHLPRYADMCRLQRIQKYLDDRIQTAEFKERTILEDPSAGCFAERYYDEYDESGELTDLHERIVEHAANERKRKEKELALANKEFERIESEIAQSSCIFIQDGAGTVHDDYSCKRCFLSRKKQRMRIHIHEHPLPSDLTSSKAVLFELLCPAAFAIYRSTTWEIILHLGQPQVTASADPRVLLAGYIPLQPFVGRSLGAVSLASTRKSFLDTHYRLVSLPADVSDVCLPNGLKFGYYDSSTRTWPGRQTSGKFSLAHHCQWAIPSNSALACLKVSPTFAVDSDGPSSHEILASQTKCPTGVSAHEFMAYQSLFSGKHRRWLSILVELGSSNLNFSKEETSVIIAQLAVQAGPAKDADPLRVIHCIFRDKAFCSRLLAQLQGQLDVIAANWRENNLMDLLITLLLRIATLAPRSSAAKALNLLAASRRVTVHWIRQLRDEIHQAKDPEASRRCSRYALWAALLCRRTYASLIDESWRAESMQPMDIQSFVEASITLQDNLLSDPATLPASLKHAVIRDFRMRFLMKALVRDSIKCNPDSLTRAIDNIWPKPIGGQSRTYSSPKYVSDSWNGQWVEFEVDGNFEGWRQTVHYEMNEGHLLIDGRPVGRLPAELRECVVLEELFGRQSLLTYTSSLPEMSHMLTFTPNGHQIHIGLRDGIPFIRAYYLDSILELIPRTMFEDDLPASLVENCVHWLNVRTGKMEVRQRPDIWISEPSNWIVDVRLRVALRRNSSLVDPHSPLFQKVAHMFHGFEHPAGLTVFQPEKWRLSVELHRLELSFHELKAEIDPDQDAGTWYGLDSKIVVRDVDNTRRRSILVPMGPLTWSRNDCHVAVLAQNIGDYGIFTINDVLGRIDCQCESRLLYMKAQLHAFTSFVLPDPLTRRNGTEEALNCLKSSLCQPWMPLNPNYAHMLSSLARLAPKRVYYPKGLKSMQQVFWDPALTTNIQNDEFWPVMSAIHEKSTALSIFSPKEVTIQCPERGGDGHLSKRSQRKRCALWRPKDRESKQLRTVDVPYEARDSSNRLEECARVYEAVSLIRSWDARLPQRPNLMALLNGLPNIQGHGLEHQFNRALLSNLLNVDLGLEWGSVVDFFRQSSEREKHALSFLFGTMSFGQEVDMDFIRLLVTCAVSNDLKAVEPPKWQSYSHFRDRQTPSVDYISQLIDRFRTPYVCDELRSFNLSAKLKRKLDKEELEHTQLSERDARLLAQHLAQQWPCPEPTIDGLVSSRSLLIDTSRAVEVLLPEWLRLFQNWEFSGYIAQLQQVLDQCCLGGDLLILEPCLEASDVISGSILENFVIPTLGDCLLEKPCILRAEKTEAPTTRRSDLQHQGIDSPSSETGGEGKTAGHTTSPEVQELEAVVSGLVSSTSTVRKEYGKDLGRSLDALKVLAKTEPRGHGMASTKTSDSLVQVQNLVSTRFNNLCEELQKRDTRSAWLIHGGLWPCISPITLLELLRSNSKVKLEFSWKEAITQYALSITELQKMLRIDHASLKNNQRGLQEERKNLGHENWSPMEHPDWLLLEIDANILIRPDQVDVALATISPASGGNSVLQMNMGQGKTSCIMPMVAAVLANSKKLVRVIVPKALLVQTAQTLQARLGNLLGREVRHVPFSRKTPTAIDTIRTFLNIHRDVLECSGVIVAQPEHVMSFSLSGIQRLSDDRHAEAVQMVKAQKWMRKVSRDVLDECDFTLAVRTQLIYPSGRQTHVDGHPDRWELPEALLKLVQGHLWNLQQRFPRSIEVVYRREGGFPWIFFLRKDVEEALVSYLVEDVVLGRVPTISLQDSDFETLEAVRCFISKPQVDASSMRQVETIPQTIRKGIHQLRGLLVHRILLVALKKRWNVQYGLHPLRDPIAVPYYAKGLRESLQGLVKADDPSSKYDRWVESVGSLPGSLREWKIVNIDDDAQLIELWGHFRYSVVVIDYYLNHSVFPRHAKQFQTKIQASGWDIPYFDPQSSNSSRLAGGPPYRALTTGFSGTNDNRTMLPLTIKQDDLPGLLHTNADVLTYLLQPRNRGYFLAANCFGTQVSELELLEQLCTQRIRVLIDAGAQILEMDNKTLAKTWMSVDLEAKAALYFKENKPFILYRNGNEVPLLASPFVDDLRECLVYLDEAHTRGTDLKLPGDATGALTLGLGQTKDHTVQAAMRLRQLASTQSVIFVATPEVHQSVMDHNHKADGSFPDSRDVICWLLEQTCAGIEQLQPLYYSQGMDFCRRAQAAIENPHYLSDTGHLEAYLKEMRRKEHQTLEKMYQPRTAKAKGADVIECPQSAEITSFRATLNRRRKGFQDVGNAVHGSALQEVEQEREVTQEVEAVREVQKPFHVTPLKYAGLHEDIATFARTGKLAFGSPSCEHLSVVLTRSATGRKHRLGNDYLCTRVLVSREFLKTVVLSHSDDNFLRPVSWVLWGEATETALVVTPEEAEDLVPIVRKEKNSNTNLLTYASPITKKMLQFNRLRYYGIPELPVTWNAPQWMTIELGLLAGRVFFEYEEYDSLAKYFGIPIKLKEREHSESHEAKANQQEHDDHLHHETKIARACFRVRDSTTKTLEFLREWLAVRRKGQDFTNTPMGAVCQGKLLRADHPFFSQATTDNGLISGLANLRMNDYLRSP